MAKRELSSGHLLVKGIVDEDFVNYKTPSMVVLFPTCSFKCDKECGKQVCQNSALATAPNIEITVTDIVQRYLANPITKSVVCMGLEPFDDAEHLVALVSALRNYTQDDIVIYTGYTESELLNKKYMIIGFRNIVIKYGRYVPNQQPHFDEVLGVNLASDNQYARRYE